MPSRCRSGDGRGVTTTSSLPPSSSEPATVSSAVERPDRAGPPITNPGPSSSRSTPIGASSSPPTPTSAHIGRGRPGRRRQRQHLAQRDPGRQHVDPGRPLRRAARTRRAPGPRPAIRGQRLDLRRAGRVGVEQGELRLHHRVVAERPPGRHRVGHLLRLQPGQPVVVAVAHPQHQLVLDRGRQPAQQRRPVAGDDRPQPDRRALAQDPQHVLGQPAAVELVEGGHEALPPVEQEDQVRQPLLGSARRPAARRASRTRAGPAAPAGGRSRPAARSAAGRSGRPGRGRRPRRSAAARPAASSPRCRSPARRGGRRGSWSRGRCCRRCVRSAVDRPDRGAPAMIRWLPCSRSSSSGTCAWFSGRSSIPNGTAGTRPAGRAGAGAARVGRQRVQRDLLAQRRQPRAAVARATPAVAWRLVDRVDQHLQVGLHVRVVLGDLRALDRRAEPVPADHARRTPAAAR